MPIEDPRTENKVWYLRQNRLFARASDEAIASGLEIFTTTIFPARSLVFEQGDVDRVVFLIKRGKVRISRRTIDGKEVTVAVLGAGDIFGEETLFSGGPRATVAMCLEESLLCTSKASDLFALLHEDPTLALNVAQILSERLGDASEAMEDLAYARVTDRLMHLFQRLASEHGRPIDAGSLIDVRLTHSDLASLVGSTRETVSLELANLTGAGRLATSGRRFVLPHAELPS